MQKESASTPRLRTRKGSLKEVSLSEVAELLRESEERIKAFVKSEFDSLAERIDKIESKLSVVQTQCVRLDGEMEKVKEVISDQMLQLENHEKKLRERNIIVSNVPESDITVAGQTITCDSDKVMALCEMADLDIDSNDVVTLQRLGKRQPNKNRPLMIQLDNKELKFKLLNKRKKISKDESIKQVFRDKIYVNPDSSYLMQKEEFRLRQKLRQLKNANPEIASYIRSGVLYSDGAVVDKADVRNQFF